MNRYSVIKEKNPREIVMLRGSGCCYRRCTFCDYHLDASSDAAANFALNREVLSYVTGIYRQLEIINSGSFVDLDEDTVSEIRRIAEKKNIRTLHFESHYMHRDALPAFRGEFEKLGIECKFKIGVETFDVPFRENVLKKGMGNARPEEIAGAGFHEINLLFGIEGQTEKSMRDDIRIGLSFFERVCVNIMTENSSKIRPSRDVIALFTEKVYPLYREDPRVDILLVNTDFGVG